MIDKICAFGNDWRSIPRDVSMIKKSNTGRVIGAFSLAMMTAVSVDSVRNLPASALFGSSIIFFFIIAAILFLMPSALISAELASSSDDHAGVYSWVKDAFGKHTGFLAVWFQWIENVIWYPAILSFVAGTIGFLFSPTLAANKGFLIAVILIAFWATTFLNLFGIKTSTRFSNFCAIAGLIIPMSLIIAMGLIWYFSGEPLQIHFSPESMIPHAKQMDTWVALTGIILSFCGMEIATVHAGDVKNPQKAYPKAMLIATIIIMGTLLSGSLAIAFVLPVYKINLVAGIMQTTATFFAVYHVSWLLPVFAIMLVIGGMGSVNNWIIAPTRGLLYSAKDDNLPKHLQRQNRYGAPSTLLLYQAIIVSIVAMVYLLLPTVNASYWYLTALATQLYMIMYALMFLAAIRLRYVNKNKRQGFRIPGGNFGMWLVAGLGIIGTILTLIISFIPPNIINIGGVLRYEGMLIIGLIVMSLPPFVFRFFRWVSR